MASTKPARDRTSGITTTKLQTGTPYYESPRTRLCSSGVGDVAEPGSTPLTLIALFEIGSLVCTTAPNSVALIVGRAIAGLGAAGIFSGGILITTRFIPLSQRAGYLGVRPSVFRLAAIIGPFLGGALTDRATWRWCFGINPPLGVITAVFCAVLVRLPPKEAETRSIGFLGKLHELDLPSTISMVGCLICLLIALQWGGSAYPWNNGRVIAIFVVSGVLAAAFLITQAISIRGNARTIPFSVARNRDIWLAGSYAMCITGGVYVAVLYLPVWFQIMHGDSALSSGVMLTPLIAGYVVCSVVAGGVTSAIGYYSTGMIMGTALAIAGSALLTTINLRSSTARITVLPSSDVPLGVTLITLLQNLSASVFVAVAQSVFQSELRSRLQPILPNLDVSSILTSGAGDFISTLPLNSQAEALEAYSTSLVLKFYISLALSVASVVGALSIRWGSMHRGVEQSRTGIEGQMTEQNLTTDKGGGNASKDDGKRGDEGAVETKKVWSGRSIVT
ncbi:Uu.00g108530.m01.CDS01 [Anthostomella pinea]|uniref:Uu.00g108530.m01.CDS01 n=1 Tax=Anthostomella pinea TaxID=933095 RepID=A0AAI8VF82_9PEZI|nr:Uu.00g108530.m01.CDS01 [Anthostomella pinea]